MHGGHFHHESKKEVTGCIFETHGILAPKDAHAANHGYDSKQTMKAIVYDKDYGEMERHTFNPRMLDAIDPA